MENQIKPLIIVRTAEMARRADFYDYLDMLEKPIGTGVARIHGQSPARSCNITIEQAIELKFTHVLFIDDDVQFAPNALIQLLAHDKDIVSGLYLMRSFPHHPVLFDDVVGEGHCFVHYLSDNESGLVKIVSAGLGFLLVKTSVLERMIPFCPTNNGRTCWSTLGEIEKDHWGDDTSFFKHAKEAGITDMWCDLNCYIGHMAQVTIWPNCINGKWHTSYDTKGRSTVSTPQLTMDEVLPKREEDKRRLILEAGVS